MKDIQKQTDFVNKQIYIHKKGESMEHYIKNSIPIKLLMQHENDGLGHVTISQLLDVLQDLYKTGKTDNYEEIEKRRKAVNHIK